jgi:hypothetical protein
MLHRFERSIDFASLIDFGVDRAMQFKHSIMRVLVQKINGADYVVEILVTLHDLAAETSRNELQEPIVVAACREDGRQALLQEHPSHGSGLEIYIVPNDLHFALMLDLGEKLLKFVFRQGYLRLVVVSVVQEVHQV